MKLSVEHRVLGAPVNDRGDGVLSVTGGVSERGSILLSEFLDSSSSMPEDHATMLFFRYPATGLYTIIHYQAKFTAFPEHSRWYDERAIYELPQSEFGKINYSFRTLLPTLDKFGEYTTRHYGVSNEMEVVVAKNSASDSDKYAQTLKNAIVQGVLNNKKVFIQLGNDDKDKGDAIRKSTKLNSLLEAVAFLPESWRKQVSVAYGVENHARVFGRIVPEILVFAIFDDVSNWGEWAADAIVIDWTGSLPKGVFESVDEQKLAVVDYFCNRSEDFKTTQDFTSHFGSVWEKVNRYPALKLDGVKTLPTSEVASVENWYKSGAQAYRHKDISLRLLWLSALGRSNVESKSILGKYPELKDNSDYISIIKESVKQTCDFKKLSDCFDANKDVKVVCSAIGSRILENRNLTDACADNSKTPLSIHMQDSIKELAKRWSDDEKIARLDKPYFGLSVEKSFAPKNWNEYWALFRKMEGRKDINKLSFSIRWTDKIPAALFSKMQNCFSDDDLRVLYDKIVPPRATLNDYADVAYSYGKKIYPFIIEDVDNAALPADSAMFEDRLLSLLNSTESSVVGKKMKSRYVSLLTSKMRHVVETLRSDCSDFLLREITNDRVAQAIEYDNNINAQLESFLNRLYGIEEKRLIEKRNMVLDCLADWYIHAELLSETDLSEKSFWKIHETPQKNVTKWLDTIVVKQIATLNDEDMKTLGDKCIKYYNSEANVQGGAGRAKRFVKRVAKLLVEELQRRGFAVESSELKSLISTSVVPYLLSRTKGWSSKRVLVTGLIMASIVGVVIAAIVLARGCNNNPNPGVTPPVPEEPSLDTLYYKMLIDDTLADSVKWQSVPLDSTHPILLFANIFLDSLYQHEVSAYVEMRVSNVDSIFRLQVGSDSIWFISRLLPMSDYYDYVLDKLNKLSADTMVLMLKCVDSKRPKDTIQVIVDTGNPLIRQILANDTLKGCNVVGCNGGTIDNTDFQQRNGHLRTLGRTDYYLWIVQQLDSLKR